MSAGGGSDMLAALRPLAAASYYSASLMADFRQLARPRTAGLRMTPSGH